MDVSEETEGKDAFPNRIEVFEESNDESESIQNNESTSTKDNVNVSGESPKKKIKSKSQKSMKSLRVRPNYFLGFQVYNPVIHQKVRNFQQELIKNKPDLYPTLIKVPTLHITLAVTHLANENEVDVVRKSLQDWGSENIESFVKNPITLNFKGINTFSGRVAYLNLEQCENYDRVCDLANDMKNILQNNGFPEDTKDGKYTPHLTILKVRKDTPKGFTKKDYKKEFELLKKCDDHFGSQLVSHVQLLSMTDPKDEKGYYKCLCQVDTSDSPIPVMDHSDCCKPIPEPSWRKTSS